MSAIQLNCNNCLHRLLRGDDDPCATCCGPMYSNWEPEEVEEVEETEEDIAMEVLEEAIDLWKEAYADGIQKGFKLATEVFKEIGLDVSKG